MEDEKLSRFKTIESILNNFNENLNNLNKAKSEKFQFLTEKLKAIEQILEEKKKKKAKIGYSYL